MEGELWAAVIRGGVATASLMALIIWIGKNGNVWVWSRELHAAEKERIKDQAEHKAEILRMEKSCVQHLRERDEWRDIALDALGVAERVTRHQHDPRFTNGSDGDDER